MTTCAYTKCDNPVIRTNQQRYCSRACQVAAYRERNGRGQLTITIDYSDRDAITALAADCDMTINQLAAQLITEGLRRCGA